ncbi:hypothetical protein [Sodalinema gerasimenkoae]|uniref:hypothetical protein n=1 Tax=Sodalinema gerasimenkoae TaxID=2862348 RepID=UPI003CCD7701
MALKFSVVSSGYVLNRDSFTEERNGVKIQRCFVWVRPKPGLVDRILLETSFVGTSFIQAVNGSRP